MTGKSLFSMLLIGFMIVFVLMACGSMTGCNAITRSWGGTQTISLDKGNKLVNLTWKENASLWVLTRQAKDGEQPQTYEFREHSNLGVMQGKVIIKEQ